MRARTIGSFGAAFELALSQSLARAGWEQEPDLPATDADLLIIAASLPPDATNAVLNGARAGFGVPGRGTIVITLDIGAKPGDEAHGEAGFRYFRVTTSPLAIDRFNPDQARNPQLLPEELADLLLLLVTAKPDVSQIHLAPGADRVPPLARLSPMEDTDPAPTFPGQDRVERLFRRVMRLPASQDLSAAALGETPGWDSLKHLELLLQIETELAIRFTSTEMDRLHLFSSLRSACLEKLEAIR